MRCSKPSTSRSSNWLEVEIIFTVWTAYLRARISDRSKPGPNRVESLQGVRIRSVVRILWSYVVLVSGTVSSAGNRTQAALVHAWLAC